MHALLAFLMLTTLAVFCLPADPLASSALNPHGVKPVCVVNVERALACKQTDVPSQQMAFIRGQLLAIPTPAQ